MRAVILVRYFIPFQSLVLCCWGFFFALAAFVLVNCVSIGCSLSVLITNHRALALSIRLRRAVG